MYDVRRCVEYDSAWKTPTLAEQREARWSALDRVCFSSVYHCERGQSILSHALSLRDTLVPGNHASQELWEEVRTLLGGPCLPSLAPLMFIFLGTVLWGVVRQQVWENHRCVSDLESCSFCFLKTSRRVRACLYQIKGMVDSKMKNQLPPSCYLKTFFFFWDERWDIQHNVDTIVISV